MKLIEPIMATALNTLILVTCVLKATDMREERWLRALALAFAVIQPTLILMTWLAYAKIIVLNK